MPPPHAPPTPASSTDIRGKDSLLSLAPVLALPPSAYSDRTASSTPPSAHGSDSSYRPASPTSPVNVQRKQSSASQSQSRATKNDDAFALPPPPTRSRKIIQMKPKGSQQAQPDAAAAAAAEEPSSKGAAAGRKGRGSNGGTSAQGRKIARKTAHSLIERRRRSKMNEEFGVLKDMIPACQGQEMHKLAILQASIDYLRYLEQCITDLNTSKATTHQTAAPFNPSISPRNLDEPMPDSASSDDEEMSEAETSTPAVAPLRQPQHQTSITTLPSISSFTTGPTTSPAIPALDQSTTTRHGYRNHSISSTSQASYSPYIHSQTTSPFFGPAHSSSHDPSSFALTSPALRPQDSAGQASGNAVAGQQAPDEARRREQELDKEAMAALLMLNADRRTWRDRSGRGMSVQDLLSN